MLLLGAAAALAGCTKESHTIVARGPDTDDATDAGANAPMALPPSITASKTYRCADNQIVYVNWLSDNKSATVRTDGNASPTQVTSAAHDKPMTGPGGFEVSGTAAASSVRIATPGHAARSCKA
jgi:hypothetical protein